MNDNPPTVTGILISNHESALRIGGFSLQGGRLRARVRFSRRGWRGALAALGTGVIVAATVYGLFALIGSWAQALALGVMTLPIWIFSNAGPEYEFSFGTGILRRHTFFCGLRVRSVEVAGPGATYVLGEPMIYNSDPVSWTVRQPPALAMAAVEIGKDGGVQRTLILHGKTKRQADMLRELAATLTLRNRMVLEGTLNSGQES
jgi:hypothetical protein